jgi:hypothetical protein
VLAVRGQKAALGLPVGQDVPASTQALLPELTHTQLNQRSSRRTRTDHELEDVTIPERAQLRTARSRRGDRQPTAQRGERPRLRNAARARPPPPIASTTRRRRRHARFLARGRARAEAACSNSASPDSRSGRTPPVSPHAAEYCIAGRSSSRRRRAPSSDTATRQRAGAPRVRSSKAPFVLLAQGSSRGAAGAPPNVAARRRAHIGRAGIPVPCGSLRI